MARTVSAALLALSALLLAAAPAGAEESFKPNKTVEADISACLASARAKAPDATAHGQRILLATQCICSTHKELCAGGGVPQDGHMRERIDEDK